MRVYRYFLGTWFATIMVHMECRECGYRGALIIEDRRLAEKIKEAYFRKTKRDGEQPDSLR